MHRRSLQAAAAVAAVSLLALLPLGSGALAASSSGADGDIVFATGGGDLDIRDSATGTISALGLSGAADPAWSPDGTMLAFSKSGSIVTCSIPGCSPVSGALDSGTSPAWSPDGGMIAYAKGGQVWTIINGGGSALQLTSSGGADPTWSPASIDRIAFTRAGGIYTIPSETPGAGTQLAATGTSGAIAHPAWSPDGTQIAFEALDSGGHTQIWVVPYNAGAGGTAAQVTTDAVNKSSPQWSPSGDSIVFAEPSAGIFSVTHSGVGWTTPTQLHAGSGDSSPDWQTIPPINVTPPTISGAGNPASGDLVTATNGIWQGADADGFRYQWESCDASGANCSDISGETSQSYVVVDADIGTTLRVVVTASDAAGDSAPVESAATGVVVPTGTVVLPSNTTPPTATVFRSDPFTPPFVGDLMIGTTGTWNGTFPITFTYQWVRCDANPPNNSNCFGIPGATTTTFVVPAELYGYRLRLRVTATNKGGTTRAYSLPTGIVGATLPKLEIAPPIFGSNVVGQTLSVSQGTWTGVPRPTITYEWRRCDPDGTPSSCVPIPGATSASYIPAVDDIGHALRVYLTGTNILGTYTRFTVHTFPIVDKQHFAPSASIAPTIQGIPQVGLKLTAGEASFLGDTPITTKLQWQRCDATGSDCKAIRGATRAGYTPTRRDIGSTLRLAESATNAYGHMVATSVVTEPISLPLPHRRGKRIAGGAGSDYLVGTTRDDTIVGGRGNDAIFGMGGYDRIYGGAGNDVITVVGPGGARISAGTGSDTIYAQDGYKDTIDCGAGRDRVVADTIDVVKPDCEVVDTGTLAGAPGPTPNPPGDSSGGIGPNP